MTPNKEKALAALLTQPTKELAAEAAGIDQGPSAGIWLIRSFRRRTKRPFPGLWLMLHDRHSRA